MEPIFEQLRTAAARIGTAKPVGRHDLVGIQYVRGIAALMVVARHVSLTMAEPRYFGRPLLGGVLATGAVGVDVFFCLSGFIIAYIAWDAQGAPTMGPWSFFKRRFARIVPFMWLVVIAYAALRLLGRGTFPIWNYVRAATLFPLGEVDPSVVWTLRYEALFYGVFALTALMRRPWWLLAWALSPIALQAIAKVIGPYVGLGPDLAAFAFGPINLLFAAGAMLGLVYLRRRSSWPMIGWAAPCLMAGMATVFLATLLINYQRDVIWQVIVVGLISCACLAIACSVRPSHGPIASLGRRLGDASYCIYLTHVAIVSAILGIANRHLHSQPDVAIALGTFVLAVLAGLGLHYVVERPVIAFSQRLLNPAID